MIAAGLRLISPMRPCRRSSATTTSICFRLGRYARALKIQTDTHDGVAPYDRVNHVDQPLETVEAPIMH